MNMENVVRDLVESAGFHVCMGSNYCREFQKKHDGKCAGCEGEIGCGKMVEIELLKLKLCSYQAKSFQEYLDMQSYFDKRVEEILKISSQNNTPLIEGILPDIDVV